MFTAKRRALWGTFSWVEWCPVNCQGEVIQLNGNLILVAGQRIVAALIAFKCR